MLCCSLPGWCQHVLKIGRRAAACCLHLCMPASAPDICVSLQDEAKGKKMWELSEKLCGIKAPAVKVPAAV
jgi:hypothetical protein